MAMNPRTHRRGGPPDFSMEGLPPNPRPKRLTNAMWWLICMHDRLEPASAHGGDYVNKAGGHNAGENLPDFGAGNPKTDHSIRRAPDRTGPWWREFTCAEDWTFTNAHHGDYTEMNKYSRRLYNAMKDPKDTRPDDTFQYFIGQTDKDRQVEGWNEYKDDDESGDESHLWHQHRQYRRNIVGSFPKMWQILTIDMGWTYAEWQRSVAPQEDDMPTAAEIAKAVWEYKLTDPASTKTPKGTKAASEYVRYNDIVNAVTADRAVAPLMAAVYALAQRADVDEAALVAALAPAIAQAVVAALPADRDDITPAELQTAVLGALKALALGDQAAKVGAPPTA